MPKVSQSIIKVPKGCPTMTPSSGSGRDTPLAVWHPLGIF